MPKLVIRNATVIYAGRDISGSANEMTHETDAAELDVTTFDNSSGFREIALGLKNTQISYSGFFRAGDAEPEEEFFEQEGNIPVFSSLTNPAAAGDVAYLAEVARTNWQRRNAVGEAAGFSLQMRGTAATSRGVILANLTGQAASVDGPAVQLIANNGLTIRIALAVLRNGGVGTLDAVVESDDSAGFTSPVTVATFQQKSLTGEFEYLEVSGLNSDDFYRLSLSIAGASPDFDVIAAISVA